MCAVHRIVTAALGLVAVLGLGQAVAADLHLGIITERADRPQLALEEYGPLHAYLRDRLAARDIELGPLVVAADIDAMAGHVERGEVQVMVEGVLPSLSVRERTRRIEPGLLAWRKGQRQYYTVFFVRRDSGIEDLDELVGKTLAFESQRSTSAYFIPRATLIARGLPLASGPGVEGPEDTVSYVFAGSELNQIYWVQRGQVDAAAFNDGDWDRVPPGIKNELRIIHRSEPILRWLVSFDRDLDPRLRHEVSEALLEAAQDETGRAALQAASRIARFETLTADDRANLAHWAAILRSLP